MITADTITDEQIRELRATTGWVGPECEAAQELYARALGTDRTLSRAHQADADAIRLEARARCAEILNARAKEGAK